MKCSCSTVTVCHPVAEDGVNRVIEKFGNFKHYLVLVSSLLHILLNTYTLLRCTRCDWFSDVMSLIDGLLVRYKKVQVYVRFSISTFSQRSKCAHVYIYIYIYTYIYIYIYICI